MLITRETDYALRILRALTSSGIEKAADISEKELVPRQFIYKILKKLERAGFVEIRAGIGGGCRLKADLAALSLLDVMNAMGDVVLVNACTAKDYHCGWEQKADTPCHYHAALMNLQKKIEQELKQTMLSEMCP